MHNFDLIETLIKQNNLIKTLFYVDNLYYFTIYKDIEFISESTNDIFNLKLLIDFCL